MFVKGVAIDLAKRAEVLGLVFFSFLDDLNVELASKGIQALDRGMHSLLDGVLL